MIGRGVLAVLAVAAPAAADRAEPAVRTSVATWYGSARTTFPSADLSKVNGVLGVAAVQSEWRATPQLAVAVTFAVVRARIGRPAGGAEERTTWGNPEVAATWRPAAIHDLDWRLRLGIAPPIGSGSASPRDELVANQALVLANTLTGGTRSGVFAPGRLTMTPSAELALHRGRFTLEAAVGVPVLVAFEAPSDADQSVHSVGLEIATSIRAGVVFARMVRLSLGAGFVAGVVPAARAPGRVGDRALFTLAPRAGVQLFDGLLGLGAGLLVHADDGVTTHRMAAIVDAVLRL